MNPVPAGSSPGRYVALLRGVNVGKAARVSMADLKSLFADLGYSRVDTLLNSGNVVFEAGTSDARAMACAIEAAVGSRLGVPASVLVVSADDLERVIAENPILPLAENPSRLLVSFVGDSAQLQALEPLTRCEWGREALGVGSLAAYLWCADGVTDSALAKAVGKALRATTVTSRNWTTTTKLAAMARA